MASKDDRQLVPVDAPAEPDDEWDRPPMRPAPERLGVGGWGDGPTWAVILVIVLVGLIFAEVAYFLPGGVRAVTPPIRVY